MGCRHIIEADCEEPTTISVGIQMEEWDEELQTTTQ